VVIKARQVGGEIRQVEHTSGVAAADRGVTTTTTTTSGGATSSGGAAALQPAFRKVKWENKLGQIHFKASATAAEDRFSLSDALFTGRYTFPFHNAIIFPPLRVAARVILPRAYPAIRRNST